MNLWNRLLPLGILIVCSGCAGNALTKEPAELIVYGDHVVSMVPGELPLTDGAVAIRDGRIVAVGKRDEIERRFSPAATISGRNKIVMPGLVNGHTHAAMTLLRGVADDLDLMDWLTNYIFPAEVDLVDEDFVRTGTQLACWEMIESGTTSFVDMYYFPDAVAETVVDCGLRAVVAPSVIEQVAPDAPDGESSLRQAVDFIERWRNKSDLVIPALGAHSVYTISEVGLRRIADAAQSVDAPVAIHVSESLNEISITSERYGATPVDVLEMTGILKQPVIAAHVVHPSESDIAKLARHNTGAIHNPTSNMKLASGLSPVAKLRSGNVAVGLGTDGPASNNDLDMWEEIRLASLLAKGDALDPKALPAVDVLAMATRDGAVAIGLGDEVGQLAPGLRADLIQIDFSEVRHAPLYNVISHLVYVADSTDVVTTIVGGRVLMRDRSIVTIDEANLRAKVRRWNGRIARRLKLPIYEPRND
ncbi:MAG: amidohydrolase family protein [Pseudomonadota bacterium]